MLAFLALHKTAAPPAPVTPQQAALAKRHIVEALTLPPLPARQRPRHREPMREPGAAGTPPAPDATIRLREADINESLSGDADIQARLAKRGISSAQIDFKAPDEADTIADVSYGGKTAEVTVKGRLAPNGHGGVAFTPNGMYVGVLPLPAGTLTAHIMKASQQLLTAAMRRLPIAVTAVSVRDGALCLSGPRRQHPG